MGRPEGDSVPGVRIQLSPPHSLACFPTLWRSDEIGAWGAIHARPWTRRMPTAAAERENRLKFSVRDFGMSIREFEFTPLHHSVRLPAMAEHELSDGAGGADFAYGRGYRDTC